MKFAEIAEEIELIIEIGKAGDALDLARRLVGERLTTWAIDVRRTVANGVLDRDALRVIGERAARAARPVPVDWSLVAELEAVGAGLRAALAADAAMPRAERRERSAQRWAAQQRYEERVRDYNEKVDHVNRERGRARNRAQAAAVRAKTCMKCFQVPAASGECGC
ncbi:hypothetical protein DIZ27_38835 [Streptomyces sp. NWU339]|uniref:hypothetical protein n=1 Tax=Streptomyces sp. NWU339 TaxID=2185284 RepID=UPI000D67C89F|nr:hypothetical protein [Streptomyces sp. NWU339]PWI05491.1 hypothetical protein DIZ27_38835 [Streptomyces sp. NWU339]